MADEVSKPQAPAQNAPVAPVQETTKVEAPVSAPAAPGVPMAGAKTEEEKNVFTELFGKDKSQKAGVMDTVVEKETQKKKSFFGAKPKTVSQKETPKKISFPGKQILRSSIVVLILTVLFFYTQNSASFSLLGVNVAQRTTQAAEQVAKLNSELTVQNHLSAVLLLDQFASTADEYFYNISQAESDYVSNNKQVEYSTAAEEIKPELIDLIGKVQELLSKDLTADELTSAREIVENLIVALKGKEGEVEESSLIQDIQDLESTKQLMAKTEFKSLILNLNLSEVSDDEISKLFEEYSGFSESVSSLISKIKDSRINWSEYFNELETITKNVDPLFNTEFQGNLHLEDVRFSTDDGASIVGKTMTDDTKNFTLVSNLIDALEASDSFEDVEERSYSKSEDEENFTGSFRIKMSLESNE